MVKVEKNREGLTICHSMLCGEEGKREEGKSGWKFLLAKKCELQPCALMWPKLSKVRRATF
jgi:hypothetical protein